MGKKLFVTNLGHGVGDGELRGLFAAHGTVRSAQVILDRDTGRSKGFGFVEMGSEQEARAAIAGLDGKEVGGRVLAVHEARPREGDGVGARPVGGQRRGPGGGPGGKARGKRPPALGRLLRRPRPQPRGQPARQGRPGDDATGPS